jgi:hypothetical protein
VTVGVGGSGQLLFTVELVGAHWFEDFNAMTVGAHARVPTHACGGLQKSATLASPVASADARPDWQIIERPDAR